MRTLLSLSLSAALCGFACAAPLEVYFTADLYKGGPSFEVEVDGAVIGSGTVEEAQGQSFQFDAPADARTIVIRYTNDRAAPSSAGGSRPPNSDRNLYLTSVSFGGNTWKGLDLNGENTSVRGDQLAFYRSSEASISVSSLAPVETADCASRTELIGYANGVLELSGEQKQQLAEVVHNAQCSITITGYSSTFGSAETNDRVSLARAQAVMAYLVASGAEFERAEVVSAGETDQFGPAQADNRRVVVELTE